MTPDILITIGVILAALILFATELLSIDLVALLIMTILMLTGVVSPQEGISGFSNPATITVAFMFVLSDALLKTGALQHLTHHLSGVFKSNYLRGMILMMGLIALISAFVNNTPVVAVFIPVIIQIAYSAGINPTKMLIPLSFASILGGTCTLIGTSTNILVSGIAEESGLNGFGMFQLLPLGLVFLSIGLLYMFLLGFRLLPDRDRPEDLNDKFEMSNYLTEIELLEGSSAAGRRIMDADLVKDLDMDIIEIRRNGSRIIMPPGDLLLQAHDVLKVRCNVQKIKALKERVKIVGDTTLKVGDADLTERETTLTELVVTADSYFVDKTLKELDFRRKYRAIPLAIRHQGLFHHEQLYQTPLRAGDVILAEVKNHFVEELKLLEAGSDAPFVVLSEDKLTDFNQKQFIIVTAVIAAMVIAATLKAVPILVGATAAVVVLVLLQYMTMKDVYRAINWKIIFLLAGALSLGAAMTNSGLDRLIAGTMIEELGVWGPAAIVSGLYLTTILLTEIMSNNATAALMAPIAIATAQNMELSPVPFLMAITFAASASFITPIGYQTNTMVYSAGEYRFSDFSRVGVGLALLCWVAASLLIPVFFPF